MNKLFLLQDPSDMPGASGGALAWQIGIVVLVIVGAIVILRYYNKMKGKQR